MIIDRDEDTKRCFYHYFIVNVHSILSTANIGICMDSRKIVAVAVKD